MSGCCSESKTFDGMSETYKQRLIWVTIINIVMFGVEMSAGQLSGSQALKADALDFFQDGVTYAISFWVIGKAQSIRATAALFKGLTLLAMGLWVAGSTAYQFMYVGVPHAETMGVIGFLALVANLASVLLLVAYKDGDANVRSVWLCSRNDAIGNVGVMIAALGVWGTATGWPDLVVAAIMAGLFLSSAWQVLNQSIRELKQGNDHQHVETKKG